MTRSEVACQDVDNVNKEAYSADGVTMDFCETSKNCWIIRCFTAALLCSWMIAILLFLESLRALCISL